MTSIQHEAAERPEASAEVTPNVVEFGRLVAAYVTADGELEALGAKYAAAKSAQRAALQACHQVAAGVYLIDGEPWRVEVQETVLGRRASIERIDVVYSDAQGGL